MNTRLAAIDDIQKISLLHSDGWRETYRDVFSDDFLKEKVLADRTAVWQERLSHPKENQYVLLAENEKCILGFVCAYGYHNNHWGTLIDNLYVDKNYKGQGIGKHLMIKAAEWIQNYYPSRGMYLEVLESNIAARRFYEKYGAKNHELLQRISPRGENIRELLYTWPTADIFLDNVKEYKADLNS